MSGRSRAFSAFSPTPKPSSSVRRDSPPPHLHRQAGAVRAIEATLCSGGGGGGGGVATHRWLCGPPAPLLVGDGNSGAVASAAPFWRSMSETSCGADTVALRRRRRRVNGSMAPATAASSARRWASLVAAAWRARRSAASPPWRARPPPPPASPAAAKHLDVVDAAVARDRLGFSNTRRLLSSTLRAIACVIDASLHAWATPRTRAPCAACPRAAHERCPRGRPCRRPRARRRARRRRRRRPRAEERVVHPVGLCAPHPPEVGDEHLLLRARRRVGPDLRRARRPSDALVEGLQS